MSPNANREAGQLNTYAQLNELDEHQRIEAKACSSKELGESILETVCAYANEPDLEGGYLLLGVTRTRDTSKKFYEIIGVQDPDKLQSDLASQCASLIVQFALYAGLRQSMAK